MYGIPEHCQPLSPAEEQVLLAVWACRPPATRRDIGEKLAAKGWAPATVLNFLYRLEKKGWVKSGKDQNRNTYTPTVTRRAYGVAAMRERPDTERKRVGVGRRVGFGGRRIIKKTYEAVR